MTAVPAVIFSQEITYVNCSPMWKGREEERGLLSSAHETVIFMALRTRPINMNRELMRYAG